MANNWVNFRMRRTATSGNIGVGTFWLTPYRYLHMKKSCLRGDIRDMLKCNNLQQFRLQVRLTVMLSLLVLSQYATAMIAVLQEYIYGYLQAANVADPFTLVKHDSASIHSDNMRWLILTHGLLTHQWVVLISFYFADIIPTYVPVTCFYWTVKRAECTADVCNSHDEFC